MKQEIITLSHGNGGRLMHDLISRLRIHFSNKITGWWQLISNPVVTAEEEKHPADNDNTYQQDK